MELIKKVSSNIKKYKNGTYRDIAKRSKVPYATLEKILFPRKKGSKDIKLSTASAIAKGLGISLDKLIS